MDCSVIEAGIPSIEEEACPRRIKPSPIPPPYKLDAFQEAED